MDDTDGRLFEAWRDEGDRVALAELVHRNTARLMWVAARQGLPPEDRQEVVQVAWQALVENPHQIKSTVVGWLRTVVTNEARKIAINNRKQRERSVDNHTFTLEHRASDDAGPEQPVLDAELRAALHDAFGQIRDKCRELLRRLFRDEPASYAEIADELDIPMGSIGPTRQRCLDDLYQILQDDNRTGRSASMEGTSDGRADRSR